MVSWTVVTGHSSKLYPKPAEFSDLTSIDVFILVQIVVKYVVQNGIYI